MEKTISGEALEHEDRSGDGKILVTGATGPVGTELTRLFSASGRPARAMCRKAGQAERLRQMGLKPVIGDFDDPKSVEAAMRGCETVFLLSPGARRQAEREKGAIDAAKGRASGASCGCPRRTRTSGPRCPGRAPTPRSTPTCARAGSPGRC